MAGMFIVPTIDTPREESMTNHTNPDQRRRNVLMGAATAAAIATTSADALALSS